MSFQNSVDEFWFDFGIIHMIIFRSSDTSAGLAHALVAY